MNRTIFQFIDFGLNRKGVFCSRKMYKKMEQIFSDIKIEDLKIPYTAVTREWKPLEKYYN